MKVIFTLALLFVTSLLPAQFMNYYQSLKHWFFFPLLAYEEETSLVYGGVVIYDTAQSKENIEGQWSNVIQHSLNNQFRYITKGQFSLMEDYSTSLALRLRSWPTDIYEFGNESQEISQTNYTEIEYSLQVDFFKKIVDDLSLGVNAELGKLKVTKRDYNDYLDWDQTLGNEGGWFNGLGALVKLDTRDQVNYPHHGLYHRYSYRNYDSKWGSDYDFGMTEIDLKNYFSSTPNFILATHLDAKITHGQVPFQRLAKLGDRLRGYSSRRYMDNHRVSARAEIRSTPFIQGIYSRAGFVFFLETGKVAHEIEDLNLENLKFSYGTGFRFKLTNSADRLNMRFDLAFTDDGHSINISAYEEF